MGHPLLHMKTTRHRGIPLGVVIALVAVLGCERPSSMDPASGRRAAERTPRTRSTAAVRPPPPTEATTHEGGVVLSLAAGEHVLDCSGDYNTAMQTTMAAGAASLCCTADGHGLALQVRVTDDLPPLTVATIHLRDHDIELSWVETAESDGSLPIVEITLRRVL
jgi:hypothetical protein